jgi:hypothetical protein
MTQQPQGTTPPQNPGGSGTGTFSRPLETPPTPSPLQDISNYYQKYLGREADQPGLDFWKNSIESGQNDTSAVENAIRNSQEGQRYGVNQLYRNELGREADTEGLNFWTSQMQNGMTLDDILNQGIRPSQEYQTRYPVKQYVNPYPDGIATPEVDPREVPFDSEDKINPFPIGPIPPSFDSNIRDENGRVIGVKDFFPPQENGSVTGTPATNPYETDDFSNPGQGTGTPSAIFGLGGLFGGMNQGIIPQAAVDPVMDFVKNLDQQPMYLQNAFQQQLQRFGDPVQAARAVIGSFK